MNQEIKAGKSYKFWTQGEKAKVTKKERKLFEEFDRANAPFDEAYFSFAKTLYPERNAKIDQAEELMNQKIKEAEEEFALTRQTIMDEFENNPEIVRLQKLRDHAYFSHNMILQERIKEFKTQLGLA